MARKVVGTVLKILAACLLFAVCFVVAGALSGLDKAAQQASPSAPSVQAPPGQQGAAAAPESPSSPAPQPGLLFPFLIFSVSAGVVLSYLILRSSWHGWTLAGAIFVGMYGISTVATQVETLFFLSNKMPHGMIRAIFLQGAIAAALFAPLAVLVLGKWRSFSARTTSPPSRLPISSVVTRLAAIVVAFVFLYMFFGYYVAWQNPALRQYYGGPEQPTFFAALKVNWMYNPSIYALQVFRALLYVACMYPLMRMLRVGRWESTFAMAFFLSVWTTILLIPNPLMPPEVAYTHFRETLGFSIVFGSIAGWLLSKPPNPVESVSAS